jgi:CTP synthase (UTP-ammonia lyase)
MRTIKVGILGDFNPDYQVHTLTNNAFAHAAKTAGEAIEARWLPTDETHNFNDYQGLLCAPGSPYRSFEGALNGIRYARENGIPFLGTCGGFQHLVIEYARNVIGIADAAHAETDPYASHLIVNRLACSLAGQTMNVEIVPGTRAAGIFSAGQSMESFYCNFGLNPKYQTQLQHAGLTISGYDQNREARIVELASHPFFFGTLFVPQAQSTAARPHPFIMALCRAACAK